MRTVWLVNPYGPIEGENWREYSFNQFGKYLSQHGFSVIWWTANFSHHFKEFRSESWNDIKVNENFIIRLVPTNSYKKNISIGRFWKDYIFGINAMRRFEEEIKPDLIIASENPMCMGKPAFEYAHKHGIPIIYDQMDIWPEFLIRVLPRPLSFLVDFCMRPVYWKRKRIYENLDGAIALGKHYLEFMFSVSPSLKNKPNALVYNGIDVADFRTHLSGKIINEKIPEKTEREIWCIFAGTLGPSYDIQGIIESAKRLNEEGIKEFKIIIAGSGPLEEIVKNADENLDNLIYIGKLLPSELIPIYGKCDIGLSAYSSGSNVDMCDKFYDYTAAGLAIVNSLKGEVSEHISEKGLGKNYDVLKQGSLYEALLYFEDMEKLKTSKENSFLNGIIFDMNKQNENLCRVVNEVLYKKG